MHQPRLSSPIHYSNLEYLILQCWKIYKLWPECISLPWKKWQKMEVYPLCNKNRDSDLVQGRLVNFDTLLRSTTLYLLVNIRIEVTTKLHPKATHTQDTSQAGRHHWGISFCSIQQNVSFSHTSVPFTSISFFETVLKLISL